MICDYKHEEKPLTVYCSLCKHKQPLREVPARPPGYGRSWRASARLRCGALQKNRSMFHLSLSSFSCFSHTFTRLTCFAGWSNFSRHVGLLFRQRGYCSLVVFVPLLKHLISQLSSSFLFYTRHFMSVSSMLFSFRGRKPWSPHLACSP